MITFRKICSKDNSFLFQLFAETRREEFSSLGWPDEQLDHFLRMQHEIQQRSYSMQYPTAEHQLVMVNGLPVGQLMTGNLQDELLLIDLSLLPRYTNQGIGTIIIQQLQQHAAQGDKPLRLHVMHNNAAKRLYERLGFRITADKYPHFAMEWSMEVK